MDLPKAYDCLPDDLMVAKLEAYGLAKESLQLISDYLSYRKQRTKIGSAQSDWTDVIRVIPQVSYWSFTFQYFYFMTFFLSLKHQTFVISRMIALCIPMAATY